MAPAASAFPAEPALHEPLRACFGVGCARHHRCARYAAVMRSEASPRTLGTCVRADNVYPMFIEMRAAR
jgi:hypothetical protein